MSFLRRVRHFFFRASPESPSTSLSNPATWLTALYSPGSKSGALVSKDTVMGITAVWRSLELIAGSIASIPFEIIRLDRQTGNTFVDYDHPLYNLISLAPAPNINSFDLRFSIVSNAMLFGNAYVYIERSYKGFGNGGQAIGLYVLNPETIEIRKLSDGNIEYKDTVTGVSYAPENILHIPYLTIDGMNGLNTLKVLREAFGFAISSRDVANTFYSNGAHLGGYIKHPSSLSQTAYERLKSSWNRSYAGTDKAGSTAILEEGADYVAIGMKPADAALLESQKFSIEDVSRAFGVPPHLLAALDRATFNNIEQLSLEFAKYTIRPWVERIEQEFNRKIFLSSEINRFVVRLDMSALMRGDAASQAEFFSKMLQNGTMSINDVRRSLGLNSIQGGDVHFVPVNLQTLEKAVAPAVNE